jgi:uncharacterized membrane protein
MADQEREIQQLRELIARLTERVYRLELGQRAAVQEGSTAPPQELRTPPKTRPDTDAPRQPEAREPGVTQPTGPEPPYPILPPVIAGTAADKISLESKIGSQWFNRIGIIAVLFGVAYFLKYAFENNWIGPSVRVLIGLALGVGLMLWSERFRTRGYLAFSFGLKAAGIGVLYLSLWASVQLYHLVPVGLAFAGMVAVTAATAAMSIWQNAEVLAGLALVGGFITPLLLSTGENREGALFSYVILLDVASLVLLAYRPWRRILTGSYIGTVFLYWAWYLTFYDRRQLPETLAFATVFLLIFAASVVITVRKAVGATEQVSRTSVFVSIMNAAMYFLQAYVMLEDSGRAPMTGIAVGLALLYLGLSFYFKRQPGELDFQSRVLMGVHLVLTIAFVTAAVPLGLEGHWITVGWLLETIALMTLAYRVDSGLLKGLGAAVLAISIIKLVVVDNITATDVFVNERFGSYLLAIAALGWAIALGRRAQAQPERVGRNVAIVAINALALLALSLEVHDYFQRQMTELTASSAAVARARPGTARTVPGIASSPEYRSIETARDFTYSAVWMIYGAALMWLGFARRSSFLRWQALLLIAGTVLKVFVFDTSHLERIFRIASFIALGVLLLAVSFAYQRDWLRLSRSRLERHG